MSDREIKEFTDEELKQFDAYEKVRQSGRFNMFMPEARKATRLTIAQYTFVMRNFSRLSDQSNAA